MVFNFVSNKPFIQKLLSKSHICGIWSGIFGKPLIRMMAGEVQRVMHLHCNPSEITWDIMVFINFVSNKPCMPNYLSRSHICGIWSGIFGKTTIQMVAREPMRVIHLHCNLFGITWEIMAFMNFVSYKPFMPK